MITVKSINDTTFEITVREISTTVHEVTVDSDYYEKLTGGQQTAKVLVEKSFEFLLERESNTSILRTFNLSDIQSYFPEFEKTIRKMIE